MKRILPPSVAVVLVFALALLSNRASAAPQTQSKVVSVDYVLALMDAGIDQKEIVRRIVEKNLTFHLQTGDIDRLREAGADDALVEVVSTEQDTSQWEHPRRLDAPEGITDGEGDYAAPSYGGYAPGYSSFTFSYGYPYYYYPSYAYYAPYYGYYSYGFHNRYGTHYGHHQSYSYRTAPRGSGSFRGAPHGSPRSSPRGSHHH